jgi:hypothetical protein
MISAPPVTPGEARFDSASAGDVGADDRLPGDRAAQRVVDRRAEHRGGRRLVRARLDVDAQLGEVGLRLHQHVQQVRDRGALVAADVRDAGLQQALGDREDALALEHLALAAAQHADFAGERDFHRHATLVGCALSVHAMTII